MSALEIVQQGYAAFGEGDMEKLASLMSDSYVGKLPESLPNGGTFNGPNDFIQNCLGKIPTLWSDFEIEPIQLYESDINDASFSISPLPNASYACWTISNADICSFL